MGGSIQLYRIRYRVESEKQQLSQLEEQNRQLRLTEAQLGDPARIDTMARQLGLTVRIQDRWCVRTRILSL